MSISISTLRWMAYSKLLTFLFPEVVVFAVDWLIFHVQLQSCTLLSPVDWIFVPLCCVWVSTWCIRSSRVSNRCTVRLRIIQLTNYYWLTRVGVNWAPLTGLAFFSRSFPVRISSSFIRISSLPFATEFAEVLVATVLFLAFYVSEFFEAALVKSRRSFFVRCVSLHLLV